MRNPEEEEGQEPMDGEEEEEYLARDDRDQGPKLDDYDGDEADY